MAKFEQLSAYDTPEVMLSMLLDGEFTARGGFNALFNPGALTPKERETISTRMKEKSGDNVVMHTLIDVALNPLVWGTFITSRFGATAAANGIRSVYTTAAEYSPWARKYGGFLQSIGMRTLNGVLKDTGTSQVVNDIPNIVMRMHSEEAAFINRPVELLMQRLGTTTLNWEKIDDPTVRARVRSVTEAIKGSLEGIDKDIVTPIGTGHAVAPRLVQTNLDEYLRGVGPEAVALRDALRDSFKRRAIRVFGVDTEENLRSLTFVTDPHKVAAIQNHARRDVLNGGMPKDVAEELLAMTGGGEDLLEVARSGNAQAFRELVDRTMQSRMAENYFPRNLRQPAVKDRVGRWINSEDGQRYARTAAAMRGPQSANVRRNVIGDYHPDDLRFLQQEFGDTGEIEKKLLSYEDSPAKVFYRSNLDSSVRRYFNDTAVSYALFGAPVSRATLLTQKSHFDRLKAGGLLDDVEAGLPTHFEESLYGKGKADIRTPFMDAEDLAPGGRWTNADVLYQDFVVSKDPYVRNVIGHFVVPAISGTHRPDRLTTKAAFQSAKQGLRAVLEGPVGQSLRGVSEDVYQQAMRWTDASLGLRDAEDTSHWLANYLYVTHMGINPASMSINLLQPVIQGAPQLGAMNVLKGYADSFKSMISYGAERASEGFRRLTDAERMARIEKHFPLAGFIDDAGNKVNLLGIGPNEFESVEGISMGRSMSDSTKTMSQRLFGWMMKGFEKTEWINRSTTANAMLHRANEMGLDLRNLNQRAMFQRDMRRVVQETQFSNAIANTPLAFMSSDPTVGGKLGGILSNPLARQYLPFMLRSMTGQFVEGPMFADSVRTWGVTGITTRGVGPAIAHDFLRMAGISAVVYEIGKNILGTDLSRGLGINAATELVGLSRATQGDSPMFLPPVVDIPFQIIRGVASDDMTLIEQAIPRLVPGGIAISKLMGVLPDVPGLPNAVDMQKTYADWENPTPEGLVPFFKGDGTLIGYEEPRALVLRGLGVDMGQFTKAGAFDNFIQKNGAEINHYRQKALQHLFNGNPTAYEGVRAEFQKRFGIPLVVSQEQVSRALKLREVPRPERMMDRLPADARAQYAQMAMETDPSRYGGIQLGSGSTASQRGQRHASSARLQYEQDVRAASVGPGAERKGPFEAYSPYE